MIGTSRDPKGFYRILGVEPRSDLAVLKAAWRRRVLEWHPDRNPRPEAKRVFQAIQEAWSVLGHPERRAAYDQKIHTVDA